MMIQNQRKVTYRTLGIKNNASLTWSTAFVKLFQVYDIFLIQINLVDPALRVYLQPCIYVTSPSQSIL